MEVKSIELPNTLDSARASIGLRQRRLVRGVEVKGGGELYWTPKNIELPKKELDIDPL